MVTRLLLLQARAPSDPMAAHEHDCFARALGVPQEQISTHNVLSGPPDRTQVDAHDALLVGGSGHFSVLDKHDFIRAFLDFLSDVVVAEGIPTFASCFGFQGLVLAGGGVVVTDEPHAEVGTFTLTVSEAGANDPLLGNLAPTFKAQLGHKDRAERLPSGMTNLAYSDRAPYQALRVDGKPIFATQFHPELNREDNTLRYMRYWEQYGSGSKEDDPVLKSMSNTPEASSLLSRWITQTVTK
jgi:GMP synthase (glutamine-hydrolysing)